jgi:nitronate monooxygenase
MNAQKGRLSHGFAFAGANAWRVTKILRVQELIDSLVEEYEASAHP